MARASGTSCRMAPAFAFAMIGKSEPTSRCSELFPLRSNRSSKPTIAGPCNAEKRVFSSNWHGAVPAARTSWPAYLLHRNRHDSRHPVVHALCCLGPGRQRLRDRGVSKSCDEVKSHDCASSGENRLAGMAPNAALAVALNICRQNTRTR